jgi:hypothetical protein
VAFQRAHQHVVEPAAPLVEPRGLAVSEQPAVGHEERGQRGSPRASPIGERDRALGTVNRFERVLDVASVQREVGEQHPPLAAGQPRLELAPVGVDPEHAAQLNSRTSRSPQ